MRAQAAPDAGGAQVAVVLLAMTTRLAGAGRVPIAQYMVQDMQESPCSR